MKPFLKLLGAVNIEALEKFLVPDGDESTQIDKILELMLKEENLHHNTDLTPQEINAFSTLHVISSSYGIDILEKWLKNQIKYRVSRNRQGRKEIVKMAVGAIEQTRNSNMFNIRGRNKE